MARDTAVRDHQGEITVIFASWRTPSCVPHSRRYCHLSLIHVAVPIPLETHGDAVSKGLSNVAHIAVLCCLLVCRVAGLQEGKCRVHHQRS